MGIGLERLTVRQIPSTRTISNRMSFLAIMNSISHTSTVFKLTSKYKVQTHKIVYLFVIAFCVHCKSFLISSQPSSVQYDGTSAADAPLGLAIRKAPYIPTYIEVHTWAAGPRPRLRLLTEAGTPVHHPYKLQARNFLTRK